jgi:N-acetylated-alpha-linked acidic dipeptidase
VRVVGAALFLAAAAQGPEATLLGFTPESSALQRAVEALVLARPEPARCPVHHRELTRTPHVAGTEGSERVIAYIAARFREYGLETEVVPYDVLLASPRSVEVELLAPSRARLATREDPVPGDPDTADPTVSGPWHAYARSGEVTADVVYVNYGRAEDYETLARLGVEVRGRVVLARSFKGYRGGKSLEAEKRGVAALLTYSDPAEDGYVQGDVYPRGPWGPDSHVQRGGNVYDFIFPGDALTPGWASLPGAKRIPESESAILPKIPSVPLSFRDARQILEALGGPVRPTLDWQGGGPFAYHVGPGPARVHVKVDVPRETRTIRNVIGRIRGADPDPRVAEQVVLLSNHHDAWTFGGVDPSSGTATMLELARVLGQLAREGSPPRRTLVFGVWDAEEFTLTGSTEWGEHHRDALSRTAVACLNGFLYHAAMARLWGLMALRLANADVLPFDYGVYGRDLLSYLDDVEAVARQRGVALDLSVARAAASELAALTVATPGGSAERQVARNRGLMAAERALLTAEGIPGRPWFQHLVYAPLPTYQAETLPGVREAVMSGDAPRARAQVERLTAALRKARAEAAGPDAAAR